MQALPWASSGTKSITSSENTASKHQQRPAVVPAALAISIAHALLSWQIGQRLGSMASIGVDYQFLQYLWLIRLGQWSSVEPSFQRFGNAFSKRSKYGFSDKP